LTVGKRSDKSQVTSVKLRKTSPNFSEIREFFGEYNYKPPFQTSEP
jgi:hypothetical protein